MLEFEQGYFKEECRCGFTICEKMKRAWGAQLEVLTEIIRICKKYDITYYADWGTLLGAVRHQGYIPWDDDLDIALKRDDYHRLLEVLPGEVPDDWFISSLFVKMNDEHNQPLSCVMNCRYFHTDSEFLERFHGCPYIVGVDISPLDYVVRDPELAETQRTLYNVVYDAARRYPELSESGELARYIPQIEELCHVSFDKREPLRRQLWVLSERIASLFGEEESDYLTWFPRTVCSDRNFRMKKEWYAETVEMPFENITVSVPKGYEGILTQMYGDWRAEDRERRGHTYPFYTWQDEYMAEHGIKIE